ncbi:hypothetical protein J6590_082240 [Homalodisca vitripennis]|nr:hypothetical protein J6590_082240 [Homalodisca vitripennis]
MSILLRTAPSDNCNFDSPFVGHRHRHHPPRHLTLPARHLRSALSAAPAVFPDRVFYTPPRLSTTTRLLLSVSFLRCHTLTPPLDFRRRDMGRFVSI